MSAIVGLRVLRGPDWSSGDEDGGEGHLGTVVSLLEDSRVRVLWDHGKESIYRTGQNDKFDLRIFDSAPVGTRHPDTACSACDEKIIYGMLWRCKDCRSCNLCPMCYVTDKHDIKHEFLRYNEPGLSGVPVKKRSVSLKIRAMGIFPGAKVKRGKSWIWKDQDGGPGSIGDVIGFENVAPDSKRNIVRVQWSAGDQTNSYRLGFQGNVDLTCVEEEAGTYYYRDHLPVLNTKGGPNKSGSSASVTDNSALFASSASTSSISSVSSTISSISQDSSVGGSGAAAARDEEEEDESQGSLAIGDKVAVHVSEDKLKELQLTCGGCTATMLKCIGKTGEVVSQAPNGALAVKFDKISYRLNPKALSKVPNLKVGDMVRIKSNLEKLKLLNQRIGWKSEMDQTAGKVGQVTKIDSDGDIVVSFGRAAYMYSAACCVPVSEGTSFDSLSTSSGSNSSEAENSNTTGESDDYGELHQDLMKFIAQMMGLDPRKLEGRAGGGGGKSDNKSQLIRAIANGDVQAVRSLCQQDKTLVNMVYKGMTPLIVAAHEGQKDVCSCLLALGANINGEGEKKNTALAAALEGKKEQVSLYLLEKGADARTRNHKQRTPLHVAAYNNMPEAIRAIVQKGGDPNAKDQFGDTPMHDAIDRHNDNAVDMLLRVKTIDLQAQNKDGFNMLQQACLKGDAHAVAGILQRDSGHVDKLLDGRFSALHIAANNDHVDCIKLLVKNGDANVNIEGYKKLTPLHMTCIKAHTQSMQLLVELGAGVNVQDAEGDTPLHCVLGTRVSNSESVNGLEELKQRARMACILISRGAYPDVANKKGADPLRCCSHGGVRAAVEQFMKENPQIVKKNARGGGGGGGATQGGMELLLRGMVLPCGGPGCRKRSDITLLPCEHKTLCRSCCLSMSECPLCHTTIERRVHKRSGAESEVEALAEACRQM